MVKKAVLPVGVETKGATKDLKKFGKDATKTAKGVEKSFSALKVAVASVAGAFAGAAILSGLKSITAAASRQEDAVNNLNQSLKASGEFSAEASKGFQDFASALQDTTKFGDEAILEQVALAKAFGATNKQAKAVTTAAIELAAATGKSLDEATRQVSKTLGGFAGELGEVNPAIKALTAEQLKAGEAAKILIEQYGGAAAAQINTFSGATAQLSNKFGDLLEELGSLIIKNPAVIQAVKDLTVFTGELITKVKNNSAAFNEFVRFIAGPFIERTVQIGKIVAKLTILFGGLTLAVKGLLAISALGGIAGVVVNLKAISAALLVIGKRVIVIAAATGQFLLLAGAVSAVAVSAEILFKNFSKIGNALKLTNLNAEIKVLNEQLKTGKTNSFFDDLNRDLTEIEKQDKLASLNEKMAEFNRLSGESKGFDQGKILEFITTLKEEIADLVNGGPLVVDVVAAVKDGFVGPPAPVKDVAAVKDDFVGPPAPVKSDPIKGFLDFGFSKDIGDPIKLLTDDLKRLADFDIKDNSIFDFITKGDPGDKFFNELAKNLNLNAPLNLLDTPIDKLLNKIGDFGLDFKAFSFSIKDVFTFFTEDLSLFGVNLKSTFNVISDNIGTAVDTAFSVLSGGGLNQVTAGISTVGNIPSGFLSAIDNLSDTVNGLAESLPEIVSKIGPAVGKAVASLTKALPAILDGLSDAAVAIVDALPAIIEGLLDGVVKILDILPEIIETIANSLGPILTKVLQALPDIILALVKAIPLIVKSLYDAIPEIAEALADNIAPIAEALIFGLILGIPDIVEALVRSLILEGGIVRIAVALVKTVINLAAGIGLGIARGIWDFLSTVAPQIGLALGQGIQLVFKEFFPALIDTFIQAVEGRLEIKVPEWLADLISQLSQFTEFLGDMVKAIQDVADSFSIDEGGTGGFIGQQGKGGLGRINETFGTNFASGGVIPQGFPSDSFPANLTSGEEVVNVSDRSEILQGQNQIAGMLAKLGGGKTEVISTTVTVNEQAFADIILTLNKSGARLA